MTQRSVRSSNKGQSASSCPGDVAAHVEHAVGFVELETVATGAKVLDLRLGGGLPALVVAVHRPDLSLTLLDGHPSVESPSFVMPFDSWIWCAPCRWWAVGQRRLHETPTSVSSSTSLSPGRSKPCGDCRMRRRLPSPRCSGFFVSEPMGSEDRGRLRALLLRVGPGLHARPHDRDDQGAEPV